jgi:hypothetical protein
MTATVIPTTMRDKGDAVHAKWVEILGYWERGESPSPSMDDYVRTGLSVLGLEFDAKTFEVLADQLDERTTNGMSLERAADWFVAVTALLEM